jgi:ligand-binding sensor domain-containing protein
MGWCATRSKNGHIWFGWQEGILVDYNPVTGKEFFMQPAEIKNKTVRQLVSDNKGNIWLGTQRGILAVCDIQTKQVRRIWDGEVNGQLVGHIMSMKTDSKKHLWVGTTHSGLYEVDMNEGKILRHFSNRVPTCFLQM